jgi:hypothetical protein
VPNLTETLDDNPDANPAGRSLAFFATFSANREKSLSRIVFFRFSKIVICKNSLLRIEKLALANVPR